MNKEIPKTDRVTFITEKNNWLDAGGVKELKMNKSKDVVQIHFENGNIAEIHSCNPYGEGRGALVVSDLVSLANVKGHASASESAGGSETAPPNDGGESDSEREAGCCAPSCSALELDGVDHDIRSYFEGDIEARYVAGIPSKIQSVRNQIELLQHLNNRQNSSNDSKQPKNNIEPQDTIGEFIRCSQMIFDGSGDFDCGFSDQCALDLFMKLGVSLGILAETGHDLTNGFIRVSGRFVRHDVSLQNVQGDSRLEAVESTALFGLVGFTDGIHGRYILGVPDNPTGIPCMNREHVGAILQRTRHRSKIRVSSKNDTMEFSRLPQGWSSETCRLEDWFDEQEENLDPDPESNPKLDLTPPIRSLDELD